MTSPPFSDDFDLQSLPIVIEDARHLVPAILRPVREVVDQEPVDLPPSEGLVRECVPYHSVDNVDAARTSLLAHPEGKTVPSRPSALETFHRGEHPDMASRSGGLALVPAPQEFLTPSLDRVDGIILVRGGDAPTGITRHDPRLSRCTYLTVFTSPVRPRYDRSTTANHFPMDMFPIYTHRIVPRGHSVRWPLRGLHLMILVNSSGKSAWWHDDEGWYTLNARPEFRVHPRITTSIVRGVPGL